MASLLFLLLVVPQKKLTPTEIVPTQPASIAALTNTPHLTPTALPTLTPTPQIPPALISPTIGLWKAQAQQITNWDEGSTFSWLDNHQVRVNTDPYKNNNHYILDIDAPSQEPLLRVEPLVTPALTTPTSEGFLTSPDGGYRLDCQNGLELRQLRGEVRIERVAITPIRSGNCGGSWAPDSSAFAFVSNTCVSYVWPVNQTQPIVLVPNTDSTPKFSPAYYFVSWSPDSAQLVTFVSDDGPSRTIKLQTFDKNGQPLSPPFSTPMNEFWYVDWYLDNIIRVVSGGMSSGTDLYYEANSGQLLYEWGNPYHKLGISHQSPAFSPDKHWGLFNQVEITNSFKDYFALYDFDQHKETILLQNLGGEESATSTSGPARQILEVVDWKSDNSAYLLSFPANEMPVPNQQLPFGLLRLDPQTLKFQTLINDAFQLQWSPDHKWAFITAARRNGNIISGMKGLLWNASDQKIVASVDIAPILYYRAPYWQYNTIPIVWSHDGKQVVVAEPYGHLVALNITGAITDLGSGFPQFYWRGSGLKWSPDDKHVLFYIAPHSELGQGGAWVIDVP